MVGLLGIGMGARWRNDELVGLKAPNDDAGALLGVAADGLPTRPSALPMVAGPVWKPNAELVLIGLRMGDERGSGSAGPVVGDKANGSAGPNECGLNG